MSYYEQSPNHEPQPPRQQPVGSSRGGKFVVGAILTVGALCGGVIAGYQVGRPDGILNSYDPLPTPGPKPVPSPKASPSETVMGPSPVETAEASPSASPTSDTQADCIEALPFDLKVGQKIMIGAHRATLVSASETAAKYHLGGVVLMDDVPKPEIQNMIEAQNIPPLVATDQEGGEVQRFFMKDPLPAAADVPGEYNARSYRKLLISQYLRLTERGVNMNLAPVVDVAPGHNKGVLGTRMYSSNPDRVVKFGRAALEAGAAARLMMTLKHFPGEGTVTGNTDHGPATTNSLDKLEANGDLRPYEQLGKQAGAIMIGHPVVSGLSGKLPASLSPEAVAKARDYGTKDTITITDSLDAKAITKHYSIAEAAVRSITAGNDIALIVTPGPDQTFDSLIPKILRGTRQAVHDGTYTRQQLDASAARLFALPQKDVNACDLQAQIQ